MRLRRLVEAGKKLNVQHLRPADFTNSLEDFENLLTPWLFHIYQCDCSGVTFAVDQQFEDQSVIQCPVCKTDEFIKDIGSGEMERSVI